jgi:stage V sporulation protein R
MGEDAAPKPRARKFPEEPEKDLLLFLANYGRDLEDWQRDIIAMIREEMLYFLPQMRTKIMNEGFASLAHERILERYLHKPEDIWEFRRLHSGVLSPSPSRMSINPYYVGFQILKDIERRWNGDLHSEDEPETDWLGNPKPRPVGEGWKKVFEVCEEENDVTFLRKYLTEPLVKRLDLYTYEKDEDDNGDEVWVVKSTDWQQVRDEMVDGMTNFGVPIIRVEDGDYKRHGELYLTHAHDGKDIDTEYAERVLRAIHRLWGRPVHLETVLETSRPALSFDGKETRRKRCNRIFVSSLPPWERLRRYAEKPERLVVGLMSGTSVDGWMPHWCACPARAGARRQRLSTSSRIPSPPTCAEPCSPSATAKVTPKPCPA